MVDGFTRGADPNGELYFNRDNLIPRYKNKFGTYLHLHGSPLFVSMEGSKRIIKLERKDLINFNTKKQNFYPHIILNNFDNKELDIRMSQLLNVYFECFIKAIERSTKVTLIGYSGNDHHINEKLREKINDLNSSENIFIVEYLGSNTEDERREFWKEKLGCDNRLNLHLFDNILDYDFQIKV